MRIDSANVQLYNQTSFEFSHTTSKTQAVQYSDGSVRGETLVSEESSISIDFSFLSEKTVSSSSRAIYEDDENMTHKDRINKQIIERLLETINIQKKFVGYSQFEQTTECLPCNPYDEYTPARPVGFMFESVEEYYQKQTVDFSAQVEINTPNMSFSLDLNISFTQELYEAHSTRIEFGETDLIDPLVINYGEDVNPFENVSSLNFEFDLDSDGTTDMIPLLKQGAGFLAFDSNNNGIIDNGNELFGTKSGNGFKDLSVHDGDKNGWIDENDSIFNKLKIWQKDEHDNNRLVSLLDLNVGAIYLGDIQSGYKYQNMIDDTMAVQKSNGIFIKEDGSGAGMVSSLDMAV